MRSKMLALAMVLAAAWHAAPWASAQVPGSQVLPEPSQATSAAPANVALPPNATWPVQQTSYAAPVDAAPQMQANVAANPPSAAVPQPSAPAPDRPTPRRLPARKGEANTTRPSQGESAANGRPGSLGSVLTVAASLVFVLGLFLVVAWLLRKASPAGAAVLPKEVFELLGRAPLASRHQVHLVRCGRKLLLLSVSQAGIDSLAEIEDPVEVDRLAGLCAQAQPGSASMVFRQVFQQFTAGADTPTQANRGRELRHG